MKFLQFNISSFNSALAPSIREQLQYYFLTRKQLQRNKLAWKLQALESENTHNFSEHEPRIWCKYIFTSTCKTSLEIISRWYGKRSRLKGKSACTKHFIYVTPNSVYKTTAIQNINIKAFDQKIIKSRHTAIEIQIEDTNNSCTSVMPHLNTKNA